MTIADLLDSPAFTEFEEGIARRFGLKRLIGNARVRELAEGEIAQSPYDLHQIAEFMANRPDGFDRFAQAWYLDSQQSDDGEEHNPEEGNQQEDIPPPKLTGICEGFTITYLLFFLHARHLPKELKAWIKTRRIPAAPKVAKDVQRVYQACLSPAEGATLD